MLELLALRHRALLWGFQAQEVLWASSAQGAVCLLYTSHPEHTTCRATGPPAHATDADAECENPLQIQAIWSALCEGTLPPLLKHRPSMGHDSSADKAQDAGRSFTLHQVSQEARLTCLLGLSCNACRVGSMPHVPDMNQEPWPAGCCCCI